MHLLWQIYFVYITRLVAMHVVHALYSHLTCWEDLVQE